MRYGLDAPCSAEELLYDIVAKADAFAAAKQRARPLHE